MRTNRKHRLLVLAVSALETIWGIGISSVAGALLA